MLTQITAQTLATLAVNYRSYSLLLLDPSARHRTLVLAALLAQPPCPVYYYGLQVGVSTLDQFLSDWIRDLSEQSPAFGRRAIAARQLPSADLETRARAFADALNDVGSENYLLFVHDYDRADAIWDVHSFMEALLRCLPPQCHLLISSRTMPPLPWFSLIARNQVAVLREDGSINTGMSRLTRS